MKKAAIFNKALFVLLLLASNPCFAHNSTKDSVAVIPKKALVNSDSVKLKKKTPAGAMVRSILFPGLGQWYNNKKFKSLAIFCGETGLLANAIYLNQKLVKSSAEIERNFYIENRNISVWWLVGVILYSMGDAYVDAQLADFDESPELAYVQLRPSISMGDQSFVVSFSFCIK